MIDRKHYFGLDACESGEYFSNELVHEFMDQLPPACIGSSYFQMGEPVSHEEYNGRLRTTYATFNRISEGVWEYCGNCFKGEKTK